ncbi:hypothetical protein JYU34_008572 [Plutella xylostella]|uniref:WW domain-containing protein n=1 Tax=Plutella xylostella TaxID=51655 RepID=A0ABQ7QL96_PLUXY|nr:hypothetical protein JYU34_008572 [Plutella xylostella]
MMNSSKNEDDSMPDGWCLCKSKSVPGRTYYFNKKTGKSSWTKPEADEKSFDPKKGKKEKNKKEEVQKKNLKRKSDSCHDDTSPKKRATNEPLLATPEPKNHTKESPSQLLPPTRNSANKRLHQLRTRLSNEAEKTESQQTPREKTPIKSPVKFQPNITKASPRVCQTDTPNKNSKATDLKSPNFNETRCSTTAQSPSSDSLQSTPSPSQFFAANKILSSMKAQLPEKYSNKIKPKDTFADINQAICNQTPEYPSTKHPATPPQFSEASKIVSAIKSKLAYKSLVNKESPEVVTYCTAKDRMNALRTRLSNDVEVEPADKCNYSNNAGGNSVFLGNSEAMDVEEYKETKQSPQKMQMNSTKDPDDNLVLVVDTNIFIHELDVIKNVLNSHIKGYKEQPTLLVPWRVINELDRLKDNNNGNGAICKRAKAAMDYLYQSLPENNRIKGQSLRDANSHIYPCELPDDEILNCSLQQAERGKSVILLSNDKNLCNKAIINGVKSIGLSALKTQLESKVSPSCDPDLLERVRRLQHHVYQLLSNILENEMRAKYKSLWQHVLFKPPPWTLVDVLQCLLKHWLAVFNEVFPRIEHLITELKNTLVNIESKDPNTLRTSEVDNFQELSLEVARKCQIIPEYMELAKLTVERISKKTERTDGVNATTTLSTTTLCSNVTVAENGACPQSDEMAVIGAFENVWTVFSSYCAKLASGLGISHTVEDKINGDEPLSVLTSKWTVFSNQIFDITNSIEGVLNVSDESDPVLTDHLIRLEAVFKDSLILISVDTGIINGDNLRLFCTKCRNMLQEAYSKFAHLTELLDVCKNIMSK